MKSLKLRMIMLCFATVLTLGLSHAVAQASCADIMVGGNAYGDYDCRLTSSCGGTCYYNCSCSNLFPGVSCRDVLTEAGFEIVSGPECLVV
jgi:hypothetical protein